MRHRFKQFALELHRRSLWQVLGIYAVGAWVAYEVILGLVEGLGLPDWVPPMAVVLFLIGLPVVMATAFVQEGLPKQRAEASATGGEAGAVGKPPPDEHPAPTPGAARLFTWPKAITGGVLAFALLGLGVTGFMGMRALGLGPMGSLVAQGELTERDPVLVAQFRPMTGDTALASVLTEAMRVDLSQSALLRVADGAQIRTALDRMGRDQGTPLVPDIAREVAVRLGLKAVVEGEVGAAAGAYLLTIDLVTPDSGRVLASFRETAADSTDLLPAIDRLSNKLRAKAGESLRAIRANPPLTQVTTSSLPALRKYVAGREAERRGNRDQAIRLTEEALKLDPEFASAHRSLGVFLYNRGMRSDSMFFHIAEAVRLGDRLTDYERHHARGFQAVATYQLREAQREYELLLATDSTDHVALINLGVILGMLGEDERAEKLYRQAFELDYQALSTTIWNLVQANLRQGQHADAMIFADTAAALYPDHPTPLVMRWMIEMDRGNFEAARTVLRRLEAEHGGPRLFFSAMMDLNRGRLQDAETAFTEMRPPDVSSPMAALGDAMLRSYTDFWIHDQPDRAAHRIQDALGDLDLESAALADLPIPSITLLLASAGRSDAARELIDRFRGEVRTELLGQHEPALLAAEGMAAVADGDFEQGLERLESAQRLAPCEACLGAVLGLAYERAGSPADAIAAYERYITTPWDDRYFWDGLTYIGNDPWVRAPTHERLGRLLDQQGDREQAAVHYARFVELWEAADAVLQPRVRNARQYLERFTAEN